MAKGSGQKQKVLLLRRLLLERSDEDHPISTGELIAELERQGIPAERKSIYDDIEVLRQTGMEVQNRKGKQPGWFVEDRPFQLAELKAGGARQRLAGPAAPAAGVCGPAGQDHERERLLHHRQAAHRPGRGAGRDVPLFRI